MRCVCFSPFDVLPNLIFCYIFRIRPIHDGARSIDDAVAVPASLVVAAVVVVLVVRRRIRSLRLIVVIIFARLRCWRPLLQLLSMHKSIQIEIDLSIALFRCVWQMETDAWQAQKQLTFWSHILM